MNPAENKRSIQISLPSIGEEEWLALREPLESGWLTQGPQVREFEKAFAARHDVKYAIAVSNCTTALHLALLACGVGPGDEVIVPAFTWVSTANAVRYCQATPVFVDIELETFNLNISEIAAKISARTKAIIAVHLFGLCADVDEIRRLYPRLHIVEDAACAAGASLRGQPAGSLGTVGCFSFHPRKSITTGEGGMATTNDASIAASLDRMRNHGASISEEQRHLGPKPFLLPNFEEVGFNYRMTDLQGAVGIVQMRKLDDFIDERRRWADFYCRELEEVSWLRLPSVAVGFGHGWQSFVTVVDDNRAGKTRNQIMEELQEVGISTRPGTHAVHMLGAYSGSMELKPGDFPVAYQANEQSMSIPLHNRMTEDDYRYVVRHIKRI